MHKQKRPRLQESGTVSFEQPSPKDPLNCPTSLRGEQEQKPVNFDRGWGVKLSASADLWRKIPHQAISKTTEFRRDDQLRY